jgi:hypothetical protein
MTKDPDLSGIELNIDTTAKKVATATSSLKAHAQTAGRLASLTAEKTKVANVSLPSAYYELGKQCYQTRSCEKDFPELFKDIDDVANAIQKNAIAKPTSTATSFTDKARALAEKGVQVANNQKLAVQQKLLLARLGKSAYEKHGKDAGPDALIKAIESHNARLVVLEKELAVNVQKAGGKKRVLMIGGGILVAFVILGAMLGRERNSGSEGIATTGDGSPTGKTFSDKQMEQLCRQAFKLRLGMSETEVFQIMGQSPSERKYFNPADHTLPGLPVVDPRPHDTCIWSSTSDPGYYFVMVTLKEGRTVDITANKNRGRILELSE